MSPATRARLVLLLEYYRRVRRRTLRLVRTMTSDDLEWKPAPGLPAAGELLGDLLAREEGKIHRRARGTTPRKNLSGAPAIPQELGAQMVSLKRATGRFLRSVLDGIVRPRSASLLRDLEDLMEREITIAGQITILRRLRRSASPALAVSALHIPPGRALQASEKTSEKTSVRKASQ